ncbi:MAG: hypothetical protein ACI9XK_001659 [Granulosicoccus sp.]|jgi:hypothetical protein
MSIQTNLKKPSGIMVLTTTVSGMMLHGADAWLDPLVSLMTNMNDSTTKPLMSVNEYSANGQ